MLRRSSLAGKHIGNFRAPEAECLDEQGSLAGADLGGAEAVASR